MNEKVFDKVSKHIISLPALPSIVARLLTLIDDPKSSARGISKLISSDQAITAKLLRVANSSYYAFRNEINSVKLAVALLGLDTVLNIVLSVSLNRNLNSFNYDDDFDMIMFWEHSLSVGIVGKMLATQFSIENKEEIFTIGILHDIGKLIIHEYLHDFYLEIEEVLNKKEISLLEVEKRVMQTDHSEIASVLCKSWNLPARITKSVERHHRINPQEEDSSQIKCDCIINFSNYLVNRKGKDYPKIDQKFHKFDKRILNFLALKKNDKENIDINYYLDKATDELEKARDFINLLKT